MFDKQTRERLSTPDYNVTMVWECGIEEVEHCTVKKSYRVWFNLVYNLAFSLQSFLV